MSNTSINICRRTVENVGFSDQNVDIVLVMMIWPKHLCSECWYTLCVWYMLFDNWHYMLWALFAVTSHLSQIFRFISHVYCTYWNWGMSYFKGYWHEDVITWKHLPHHYPLVLGIHQLLEDSQHKDSVMQSSVGPKWHHPNDIGQFLCRDRT